MSLVIFTQFCYSANLQYLIPDEAPAPSSSFINQECDTDIKYSVIGTTTPALPSLVHDYIRPHVEKFRHGFFNFRKLPAEGDNNGKGLVEELKYCFEPRYLSYKDVSELSHFNRVTKASLIDVPEDKSKNIAGVAVVVDPKSMVVRSTYFALKAGNYGYRNVYYKRWKGNG